MPSLPVSHSQARFFGVDLGSLWRDLLTAWQGMLEWSVLSWLWPKPEVRLCLPTGGLALCRGLNTVPTQDEQRALAARFEALVLPEELLLRHTLDLPKLQPTELRAALTLEVQALNPFPALDLCWTHEVGTHNNASLRVHVVLCSRKLISQQLSAVAERLKSQSPEVWIPSVTGSGFALLPGFGENRRQRESTIWRWASALLALLALGFVAAMAISPSVQLYLRALKANLAMTSLGQRAAPAIAHRESLVRVSEQLTALALLTQKSVSPMQTLRLITEALPDDTSLLSLQIQESKVTITGQTVNAAALMKQLGSTPGLRDVKAPTPATKPLGASRESFTIEFTLDPPQPRSVS
ncbi:MAG: PilN domain-containing protein [Rhodoferax sp.]